MISDKHRRAMARAEQEISKALNKLAEDLGSKNLAYVAIALEVSDQLEVIPAGSLFFNATNMPTPQGVGILLRLGAEIMENENPEVHVVKPGPMHS